MRQDTASNQSPWPWSLCFLFACFPAFASAEEARTDQSEQASSDLNEDASTDQGRKTRLAKADGKREASDNPLARRRSLSFEASVVGTLGQAYSAFEGLGFDLGIHKNFGGFSMGLAFQYKSKLPIGEVHHDSIDREDVYGLAPDFRYLFSLGRRTALYLGLQPGLVVFEHPALAASVGVASGVYVSITDKLAVHAGIGGALWILGEVWAVGTVGLGLSIAID